MIEMESCIKSVHESEVSPVLTVRWRDYTITDAEKPPVSANWFKSIFKEMMDESAFTYLH